MSDAQPYRASSKRLVIALDVGTTFCGISYCILEPGEVPRIRSVTKYPGQEHLAGSNKVPSILYYDQQGNVKAACAEALLEQNIVNAEDEEWEKVEWFKPRMRPKSMPAKLKTARLPPLPPNKTVTQVFGDLMGYLLRCTEHFIRDTHPTANASWDTLRNSATFVIGHPNGWEGAQQAKLRQAAILGGLVPDTSEGRARVVFVSEGEASLHYCMRGGAVNQGQPGFIIADLGGGTLDFSAYKLLGTKPIRVNEMAPSICELEGSTFVTVRAKGFLKHKLRESVYGSDEHIKQIGERFDETTKRTFRGEDTCFVPFGSAMDRDLAHGIRTGRLKVTGQEVAYVFEPAVSTIVASIQTLIRDSPISVSAVYLVGGFSASPYLVSQLKTRLATYNVAVSTPDEQTEKAVAMGAVSFYLDHYVSSRVAKVSYGTTGSILFRPNDPEHVRRASRLAWVRPSGEKMISGVFFTVVKKGTVISEDQEFREKFTTSKRTRELASKLDFSVDCYRGPGAPPEWEDEVKDKRLMKTLFRVTADTSAIVEEREAVDGSKFYRCAYELVFWFGGTEVKAQFAWFQDGVERRGPAQVVFEDEAILDADAEDDVEEMDELDELDAASAIGRMTLNR